MKIDLGAFSSFTTLKVKVPSGLAIFSLRYLKQINLKNARQVDQRGNLKET
jgi:hypothetical protein